MALVISLTALPAQAQRTLRLTSGNTTGGANVVVTFQLDAVGDESAVGASVSFDPAKLSFVSVVRGSHAIAVGASGQFNSSQAASGKIGIAIALSSPEVFPAGTLNLATITFTPRAGGGDGTVNLGLTSDPVILQVVNANAQVLPAPALAPGSIIIVNTAPTHSAFSPLTIAEDSATTTVNYTVGDLEHGTTALQVTATPANGLLLQVTTGGSGANRSLAITPLANAFGLTTVTVSISDNGTPNLTTTAQFDVTVTPVNDLPTTSSIAAQTIAEDTAGGTGALAYTVADLETTAANLVITRSSSNQALVPDNNIVLAGTDGNRTVTVTPLLNKFGSATITLSVRDSGLDGTAGNGDDATTPLVFLVTVTEVIEAPTMSAITDKQTRFGSAIAIDFTLSDDDDLATLSPVATSSDTTLVPINSIVFSGSGANRTATITPVGMLTGFSDISFAVTDTDNQSASRTFRLNVVPNASPTLLNVANVTINEDAVGGTGVIPFSVDDAETAAASLTVTRASNNQSLVPDGNVVLGGSGANRTVVVTPVANGFGTATITLTVTDADNGTANDSFDVVVTSVNDLPTISNIADVTTTEDTATAAIQFQVSDVETTEPNLSLTKLSSNTTLVPLTGIPFGSSGGNRTVTITPAANQSGSSTITVTVTDENTGTASDTFVVTVTAVNDAPTVADITDKTTPEDTALNVLFVVGDVDTSVASLIITAASGTPTVVANTTQGLSISGTGTERTLAITPVADASGTSVITVTVSDGAGGSVSDTFTLTVSAVNDLPTIAAIADQTTRTNQPITVAVVVADVEAGASGVTVTGSSSNQSIVPDGNIGVGGSGANRTLTITPLDVDGTVVITVTANDGTGGVVTRTFNLVVRANASPVISSITNRTTNEDTATGPIAFVVSDIETPAGSLTVLRASSDETIVPVANITLGGSGGDRTVNILPAANKSGNVTVTLTVRDADGAEAATTFDLAVTAVNDAPTISDVANQSTTEDRAITLSFTLSDPESDPATLTVTKSSSNTTLVPAAAIVLGGSGADRTATITPAANLIGSATITLTVSDGTLTAADTFVVSVSAVNDAPTISDIPNQTLAEDTSVLVAFGVNDVDTDLAALGFQVLSSNADLLPVNNVSISGSGTERTVNIVPMLNRTGVAVITIIVSDGASTASDFFEVNVGSANDAPSISAISDITLNESSSSSPIPFVVGDSETSASTLALTATSEDADIVPSSGVVFSGTGTDRTLVVNPSPGRNGTTRITVRVTDPQNLTASSSFQVRIIAVNSPPVMLAVPPQTGDAGVAGAPIQVLIYDEDTLPNNLVLTARSSNSGVVPASGLVLGGSGYDRRLTITPAVGAGGQSTITLEVADAEGLMTSTSFPITVRGEPTPPPVSSVVADFNRDGKADLAWQTPEGTIGYWLMDGFNRRGSGLFLPSRASNLGWRLMTARDFSGDGMPDLLWQHQDGWVSLWIMNGLAANLTVLTEPSHPGDNGWRIVASGHFDNDNKADIVWQHTSGEISIWFMDGPRQLSGTATSPNMPAAGARVAAAADFDGDGRSDLLLQHSDSTISVWLMTGAQRRSEVTPSPGDPGNIGWRVVAADDYDGDGDADIVWEHTTSGEVSIWMMDGLIRVTPGLITVGNQALFLDIAGPK